MKLVERIDTMVELGHIPCENPFTNGRKPGKKPLNPRMVSQSNLLTLSGYRTLIPNFCKKLKEEKWSQHYYLDDNISPKNIGIVIGGKYPNGWFFMIMLCVFFGHKQTIRLSSKDNILLKHIFDTLFECPEGTRLI